MPDKKSRYTDKEDRMAEHIKESEEKHGRSEEDAEQIGYATVNKHKNEEKHERKSS